ncbi:hypothetical protein ADH76_20915 [Enterocloster clostridioformis]|uniref:hypothetical protein n=1 Tax=Enterocloster clostridioformis TaxID=1531 RepID=UPI00080C8690|nr:hypothetical protein [Enterocloster clostridioformis]ANU47226.1 hypothetical protein A4V08_16850 [Lachnoclostridium sp. YL32]WAK79656.1 phosphoadenosine phosphosulfate reductase [Clostridium phage Villandry]ANU47393.1 hypothetical protein A4V08_17965 [Lachnoclostridium sp. YL32]ANU48841.1 hypothetical protein A4V08_26580 [Lachnoclostridium sp. YL32]OXE63983.1 hypothetical protein ADH76_27710 [Enterocloster clostridioformis]
MEKRELTTEEWKAEKRKKKAQMVAMQALPYEVKIKRAELRAREYIEKLDDMELNAHVSVGGLDSIVLLVFLHSIGIHVPAISVSSLEDKSIQRVHKALGVEIVKPGKSKVEILNEFGFPVISKRIAGKIDTLQHPTEKNKTVRHAIITGECGAQGHYAKNSRMKLPQKWLELFAGYENENEGVNYRIAPFKVSNKCCLYMKEQPCDRWAKEHSSCPFLGLMASEGGQREEALTDHGCNYFGKTVIRSAPFTPFLRQDILMLAIEMDKWYHEHIDVFEKAFHEQPYGRNPDGSLKEYEPLETIIPGIYGTIERKPDGTLYTTGAQRTGCSMCGFGVHMETRPHRFDRLRVRNPKEWEFWMYRCCTDPETGEKFGWGRVLDYIGVEWENVPDGVDLPGQMDFFTGGFISQD